MGPSLQLTTCVLPHGDIKCCHLVNYSDLTTLHGERALVVVNFSPTTQLAAVTLTSGPLTSKLVHGVLVSQVPFLPSLVFVGLFVFPLGGGTGQTDGQDQHMMGPPSRKDGPIIIVNFCSPKLLWMIDSDWPAVGSSSSSIMTSSFDAQLALSPSSFAPNPIRDFFGASSGRPYVHSDVTELNRTELTQ